MSSDKKYVYFFAANQSDGKAEMKNLLGGKGANQAVAAAKAGGAVRFVNCVGGDSYGHQVIENLQAAGINTETVFTEPGTATGTALIMVGAAGENYLGVAPGANFGVELAVFEPVHGSAPKYTGKNRVNPTATILSGALMLSHLGETEAAKRVQDAVAAVIAEGRSVTYDLKRERDDPSAVGTQEMADAIIAAM